MKKPDKLKVWYYIDELAVFVVCFAAIILWNATSTMKKGHKISLQDLSLDPISLGIAALAAFLAYAKMHSDFHYSDARKPPFWKRATTAIIYGTAAQLGVEMVG